MSVLSSSLDADLRIQQRLQNMYPNAAVTQKLQALGYHSAHQIAVSRESEFLKTVGPELQGLVEGKSGQEVARKVYAAAQHVRSRVWSLALAAPEGSNNSRDAKQTTPLTVQEDDLVTPAPTDLPAPRPDFQQGLPNYEQLFGPMLTCDCEECMSIFGPGAYFVDLMNVISTYISQPSASTVPEWFALHFRRPDLWNLLIDCLNADTEVGYLEIVNGVMRQNLSTNFLNDEDPTEYIASANYPFSAPFNLPLQETRSALKELGTSLATIYHTMLLPSLDQAQALLDLSPEQYALITTAAASMPSLATLYGFRNTNADVESKLASQNVFLAKTDMVHEELTAMIYQNLRQGTSVGPCIEFINNGGAIGCGNPQNNGFIGPLTIEMWIHPTGFTHTMSVIGKSKTGEFNIFIDTNGTVSFLFGSNSSACNGSNGASMVLGQVPLNTWSHIAFTRDTTSQTGAAYLNGRQTVSGAFTAYAPPASTTCTLYIGYGGYASAFAGYLAEFRIWETVRTHAEIVQFMNRRINPSAANLLCYWPLNEGTGNTAHDLGPNAYNGTLGANWAVTDLPFAESEVVPGLISTLFLNQVSGAGNYLYLQDQDLGNKQPATIGIMANTTPGPLTSTALYQIAQMKRLQEQTGWAWADLDWTLKSVAGTHTTITAEMVDMLGQIAFLVDKYGIALDEVTSFWYDMKTYGRGNGAVPEDLWDRVFNSPPLMANDTSGTQPPYYRPVYTPNPLFISPVIILTLQNPDSGDVMLYAGIGKGLGLKSQELNHLLRYLAARPAIFASASTVELTVQNLSIVYRYARLAKMLKLVLDDFLELLTLLQLDTQIWTIDEVIHITETAEWLRKAHITVSQLSYLVSGKLSANSKPLITAQMLQQALATVTSASAQVRVRPDSFVTDTITAATSQTIFDQLVIDGFIDLQGLVMNTGTLAPENIYLSMATGTASRGALFPVNPFRSVAMLQNTGSSSCGTVQLGYDPFADATIQSTNTFTLAFWMQSAQALSQTWPGFVGWGQGPNNTNTSPTVTQGQSTRGSLGFSYSPQSGGYRTSLWLEDFIHEDNEWIYVTWVVKNGAWKIYRNGVLVPNINKVVSTPPYLQQTGIEGYPVGYLFGHILAGTVANVALWNIALDEATIHASMFAGPTPGSEGLIGFWPINEGTGTTIHDQSGVTSPHDGTLGGSYTWQQISNLPTQTAIDAITQVLQNALAAQNSLVINGLAGRLGISTEVMGAVTTLTGEEVPLYSVPVFDGKTNYMMAFYAAELNATTFTVAMFVMPTGNPDTERVLISSLDRSNVDSSQGYQLSLNPQNQVVFTTGNGTATYNTLVSETSIKSNLWTSVVATFEENTMNLAVNGQIVSLTITTYTPNTTEPLYLAAGLDASEALAGFFEGHIMQVMIGNVAVSKHTAMVDYGKLLDGKTIDAPNLMAWWKLNQVPTSNSVHDYSPGGTNGGALEGTLTYAPYPPNELLNVSENANPNQSAYLQKLMQNVQMAKLLRLTATEVNAILTQSTAFGTANIGFETTNLSIQQLETLSVFKALSKAFGDNGNQLLAYFALASDSKATVAQRQAFLSLVTGWPQQDIATLEAALPAIDPATVKGLFQLSLIFEILSQTGLNVATLQLIATLPSQNLVNPPANTDPWQVYLAAAQATQAALRTQGKGADATVVGQTQAALRDCLASLLIWELNGQVKGIRNEQDLYEYLLIDVKMSPEVKTSYLVSAMNSLQLYVNRCYNNMEPGIVNEVPARWWEWMSSYRVWQANREVYLYPENYVDPSLRKLKSQEFRELESALSKGQVNDDTVRSALTNYLGSIQELANLELMDGFTTHVTKELAGISDENQKAITYIAGRSRSNPTQYYVRTILTVTNEKAAEQAGNILPSEVSNMQFGPWEAVNLGINADYVSLAYAFGKLFMFWVQRTEKTFTTGNEKQATAVYASIYYSYRGLSGSWVPATTIQADILIAVVGDSNTSFTTAVNTLFSDFLYGTGMTSPFTPVPYYRDKTWNKVKVMFLPVSGDGNVENRILLQYGAMGTYAGGASSYAIMPNISGLQETEVAWLQTCVHAANAAFKYRNMSVSFLPSFLLSPSLDVTPFQLLVEADVQTVAVVEAVASQVLEGTNLSFVGGPMIFETDHAQELEQPASFWPMVFNSYYLDNNNGQGSTYAIQDLVAGQTGQLSGTFNSPTGISPYNQIRFMQLSGGFVNLPFTRYQSDSEFTVSFLFQIATGVTEGVLASYLYNWPNPNASSQFFQGGWELYLSGTTLWLSFGTGVSAASPAPNRMSINTSITIGPNTWNFFSLTISPKGNFAMINNGEETLTNLGAYVPLSTTLSNLPLVMGKSTGYNFATAGYPAYYGILANVKYWASALTPDQMLREWAATLNPYLLGMPSRSATVQHIGNSMGSFLLNMDGQGYMAVLDQVTQLMQSITTLNPEGNEALRLTVATPSPALSYPLRMRFVRINTDTVSILAHSLATGGLDALMAVPMQYLPEQRLEEYLPPVNTPPTAYPEPPSTDIMDFEGAFGMYFWELFFYAPFMVADKLRLNQQFADAQTWYKYIFDPTADDHFISYWPLGGLPASNKVRDAVGGYSGTAANVTLSAKGAVPFALKERKTYYFNGTNASITIPYNAALNPPQFTFSAWILLPTTPPAAGTTSYTIACSQNGYSGYQATVLFKAAGAWNFSINIYAGGWLIAVTDNLPLATDWQFVAGTFDGTTLRAYVNGIELASEKVTAGDSFAINTNSGTNPVGDFIIGAGNSASNSQWYFPGGNIADVGLWDRPLTSGEVSNLYTDYKYQRFTNRFWRFAPFRRINTESLYHILRGDPYQSTYIQPAEHYTANLQMAVYRYDPFDPDAIAKLRVDSYQKATFARYISNLTAWGDQLFTQNTWETISTATMQYVLAADLLGKLPVTKVTTAEQTPHSYADMVAMYGDNPVPDFLIDMEADVAAYGASATLPEQVQSIVDAYFCIPSNTQLLSLWEVVADRLYKIRHGLTITGQQNDIPLYAPAIDPAALVAAAGAGRSLTSASASPSVPAYRFSYMIGQAKALCSEVIRLGGELLAALEKQDAEQLAQMQTGYQVVLNEMMIQAKAYQLNQLQMEQQALYANLSNAKYLQRTYQHLLDQNLSFNEKMGLGLMAAAALLEAPAAGILLGSTIAFALPTIFGFAFGGMQFGEALNTVAQSFQSLAQIANTEAQLATTVAQFERRMEDWQVQYTTATNQITELNAQIQANAYAQKATLQDIAITQTQYQQSQEVFHFLKTKFTNVELYQWMAGQVSGVYFQTYQLAFSMAQSAQVAFQYELNSQQNFLNPGAWNSLYQGLLAGDTLSLGLEQMESAYVNNSMRKLNVRKTYSLRQNDPLALLQLMENGSCHFDLTELLYDLDFPSHYNRKIKTLSVSIPAVVGPYQNIHATLVQTHNSVVTKPSVAAVEYLVGQTTSVPLDGSIRSNWNPNQEIVISTGVNDSGVFQVNLDDPLYLPFEGTGAVSGWQLTIPQAANGFSLRSISDVILTVEYTAQDGGITYKNALTAAITGLKTYDGLYYISMRQLFSGAWYNFLSTMELPFELVQQMFPQNLASGTISLGNDTGDIMLFPILAKDLTANGNLPPILLNENTWDNTAYMVQAGTTAAPVKMTTGSVDWEITLGDFPTDSSLLLPDGKINPAAWLDIVLVVPFSGNLGW